jgi:mono/diheme cytochrome c family protein
MRRLLSIAIVIVVVLIAFYWWRTRPDDTPGTAPALAGAPSSADARARGEYLARAADCVACHTRPDSGQPYAGGVPFKLPFGTIYSSNITPDRDTGIGAWSDDEFVRALREGVAPGGRHLYPAFPYTAYTALSREDVLAIKQYLFSLPAIHAPAQPNELSFPFNQRWAVGVWNAVFFHSHRFEPDASKPVAWNSGAYLAQALAHCGECHTPRNFAYALKSSREFAGEEQQGWRAYNISSDRTAGIGDWSEADLAAYLQTGHAEGHGSAGGPMAEAVENSLQYLEPADTAALVTYVRAVPPQSGPPLIKVDPAPKPVLASTGIAPHGDTASAEGASLFAGACVGCHTWNGKGLETSYAALLGARSVNDPSGANATEAILHGTHLRAAANDALMPGFANGYSDAEVAALTNYVIGHFGGASGEVTADEVRRRRTL